MFLSAISKALLLMSTPSADTLFFFKERRIEIIRQPLPTPSSNNEIFLSFFLKDF